MPRATKTERNLEICQAVAGGATYQSQADAHGISRQRVEQVVLLTAPAIVEARKEDAARRRATICREISEGNVQSVIAESHSLTAAMIGKIWKEDATEKQRRALTRIRAERSLEASKKSPDTVRTRNFYIQKAAFALLQAEAKHRGLTQLECAYQVMDEKERGEL